MNKEFESTTIVDPAGYKFPDVPLNEMRDGAILLSMASEYLCEDYFLKKTGIIIGNNAEALKDYIEHTENQFVGKPIDEFGLNEILESIVHIAELLKQAHQDIKEECLEGKLGEELYEKTKSLAQGINALEQRVDGEAAVPPARREPFKVMVNPFKIVLNAIIATSKVGLKLAITLILIGLIVFSFLYITMESEKGLVEKIEQSKANIRSAQVTISQINNELEEIRAKIASIREDEANRRDEIEVMDLNLKVFKLTEELQKIEIEADMEQDVLEKNLRNLENVRQKSFLEKLLRM
jgi:ABC-type multidrug transport system fused ATPase/permease subunit